MGTGKSACATQRLDFVEPKSARPRRTFSRRRSDDPDRQTVKELPQPQVLLTLGLLNLKPAPSSVSM